MATKSIELVAEKRDEHGTGSARELRRQGKLPAVVYGGKKEPVHITISEYDLTMAYHKGGFHKTIVNLKVGKDTLRVLPKDLQIHPVTENVLHVDFLNIDKDSKVKVWIPVVLRNRERCQGIRRGGTLNIVRHEIEMMCNPENIPESVEFDLSAFGIGESIHISSTTLPDGATPVINDRDFTVATITGRGGKADSDDDSEAEEAAE